MSIPFHSKAVVAQGCVCKRDGCGFDYPTRGMKCLMLSFPRYSNETKRGVKFRHSIRYASRIHQKVGN